MTSNSSSLSNSIKIDFRSDTVTQPTPAMLHAIYNAKVGDDVYGDDPTVNELEAEFAEMVGKERSVFFPSGTQSNLAAIMAHCGRGDEILVGDSYHTYGYEAGGASSLGGIAYKTLNTNDDGSLNWAEIQSRINPDDPHFPETRLLCLENTVHGSPISLDNIQKCSRVARENGLRVHLDGARLFNATTELKEEPKAFAEAADTISVCLSKGLGTPAGTLLGCSQAMERSIRRNRKILGGGMRQAGYLAAAGIYALNNHIQRLKQDHERAKMLASILADLEAQEKVSISNSTNMVFLKPHEDDHEPLRQHLLKSGFLVTNKKPTFRFVIHLGIDDFDIEQFGTAIISYYSR